MYTQFFGFADKPFNVTPDPKFLYLSPSHQEALSSMIYGIMERRVFVSIIGEVGTGKTTVLHTLFNELYKEIKTVFIFNTKINFNQLLQNILIELELTPISNNKTELLNQLNDFLIEKHSLGENVALIIDEAQNLPSTVLEELRMLSNLETDRDKLLQIILVGQPELDFKLRSPNLRQLKQRIGINCYITPLNNNQRIDYITHRLNIVGAENNVFTPQALKSICDFSHGIPRVINILCDNALLTGFVKDKRIIDHTIANDVIADFNGSRAAPMLEKKSDVLSKKSKKRSSKLYLAFSTVSLTLLFIFLLSFFFRPTFFKLTKLESPFPSKSHTVSQVSNDSTTEDAISADAISEKNIVGDTLAEGEKPLVSQNNIVPEINTIPSNNTQANPSLDNSDKVQNTIIVRRGDVLCKILYDEYGILSDDSLYEIVKSANPELQDIDQISVGQTIILPVLDINSKIVELAPGIYSFHAASFTSYIKAKKYLNKIMDNNYPVYLTPVKGIGVETRHRVLVGQFPNRIDALKFANNFKNNKIVP